MDKFLQDSSDRFELFLKTVHPKEDEAILGYHESEQKLLIAKIREIVDELPSAGRSECEDGDTICRSDFVLLLSLLPSNDKENE